MPAKPGSARWLSSAERLRSIMIELGFSEDSVKVYLRLLSTGTQTTAQVMSMSRLTDSAAFAATKELRTSGLVVGFVRRQRNAWYAADPATAWLSMAAEATWSVSAELSPLHQLPATGVDEIDTRSSLCRAATRPALDVWSQDIPSLDESRGAHSAEALAQLAVEAVRIANGHVRSISASPKVSGAAKFWPPLVQQMESGVRYTRLTDLNELYEHGTEVVHRDIALGVELFIGQQAELTKTRGYLADRHVLVRYEEALPGERPARGYMTGDRYAIDRFRKRFDRLARACVPAEVAVAHLDVLADSFRHRARAASQDAREWLDELLGLGRFSQMPTSRQWTGTHRQAVERELGQLGVAHWSEYGHFVPCWPDPDATTTMLVARHGN